MFSRRDLFHLLNQYMDQLDEPDFYESFLTDEEECPFCEEVLTDMRKGITIYREEVVQWEVPAEVHTRLHRTIRSMWIQTYEKKKEGGIEKWE